MIKYLTLLLAAFAPYLLAQPAAPLIDMQSDLDPIVIDYVEYEATDVLSDHDIPFEQLTATTSATAPLVKRWWAKIVDMDDGDHWADAVVQILPSTGDMKIILVRESSETDSTATYGYKMPARFDISRNVRIYSIDTPAAELNKGYNSGGCVAYWLIEQSNGVNWTGLTAEEALSHKYDPGSALANKFDLVEGVTSGSLDSTRRFDPNILIMDRYNYGKALAGNATLAVGGEYCTDTAGTCAGKIANSMGYIPLIAGPFVASDTADETAAIRQFSNIVGLGNTWNMNVMHAAAVNNSVPVATQVARRHLRYYGDDKPVCILSTAQGGTSFTANHWNPPSDPLFVDALAWANAHLALHPGNTIGGIIYGLGWSDAEAGMSIGAIGGGDDYADRMLALLTALKAGLVPHPDNDGLVDYTTLPVVATYASSELIADVTDAGDKGRHQELLVFFQSLETEIKNYAFVTADAATDMGYTAAITTRDYSPVAGDPHCDNPGCYELGNRIFDGFFDAMGNTGATQPVSAPGEILCSQGTIDQGAGDIDVNYTAPATGNPAPTGATAYRVRLRVSTGAANVADWSSYLAENFEAATDSPKVSAFTALSPNTYDAQIYHDNGVGTSICYVDDMVINPAATAPAAFDFTSTTGGNEVEMITATSKYDITVNFDKPTSAPIDQTYILYWERNTGGTANEYSYALASGATNSDPAGTELSFDIDLPDTGDDRLKDCPCTFRIEATTAGTGLGTTSNPGTDKVFTPTSPPYDFAALGTAGQEATNTVIIPIASVDYTFQAKFPHLEGTEPITYRLQSRNNGGSWVDGVGGFSGGDVTAATGAVVTMFEPNNADSGADLDIRISATNSTGVFVYSDIEQNIDLIGASSSDHDLIEALPSLLFVGLPGKYSFGCVDSVGADGIFDPDTCTTTGDTVEVWHSKFDECDGDCPTLVANTGNSFVSEPVMSLFHHEGLADGHVNPDNTVSAPTYDATKQALRFTVTAGDAGTATGGQTLAFADPMTANNVTGCQANDAELCDTDLFNASGITTYMVVEFNDISTTWARYIQALTDKSSSAWRNNGIFMGYWNITTAAANDRFTMAVESDFDVKYSSDMIVSGRKYGVFFTSGTTDGSQDMRVWDLSSNAELTAYTGLTNSTRNIGQGGHIYRIGSTTLNGNGSAYYGFDGWIHGLVIQGESQTYNSTNAKAIFDQMLIKYLSDD